MTRCRGGETALHAQSRLRVARRRRERIEQRLRPLLLERATAQALFHTTSGVVGDQPADTERLAQLDAAIQRLNDVERALRQEAERLRVWVRPAG